MDWTKLSIAVGDLVVVEAFGIYGRVDGIWQPDEDRGYATAVLDVAGTFARYSFPLPCVEQATGGAMSTMWVAPGAGATLSTVAAAARRIIGQHFRWNSRKVLLPKKQRLELIRLFDELEVNPLTCERTELMIDRPCGTADWIDAGRVLETLRRAVARRKAAA
jgi:hypothetical protein